MPGPSKRTCHWNMVWFTLPFSLNLCETCVRRIFLKSIDKHLMQLFNWHNLRVSFSWTPNRKIILANTHETHGKRLVNLARYTMTVQWEANVRLRESYMKLWWHLGLATTVMFHPIASTTSEAVSDSRRNTSTDANGPSISTTAREDDQQHQWSYWTPHPKLPSMVPTSPMAPTSPLEAIAPTLQLSTITTMITTTVIVIHTVITTLIVTPTTVVATTSPGLEPTRDALATWTQSTLKPGNTLDQPVWLSSDTCITIDLHSRFQKNDPWYFWPIKYAQRLSYGIKWKILE